MQAPTDLNSKLYADAHVRTPSKRELLIDVRSVSRGWVNTHAPSAPERQQIEQLCALVDGLLCAEKIPLAAMENVRVKFCASCRHIDATHGGCAGRALGYCRLLPANDV